MKRKRILLCGLIASLLGLSALAAAPFARSAAPVATSAPPAPIVLGTDFGWDNGGSGILWSTVNNWTNNEDYPSSTAHGAEFLANPGTPPWVVEPTTETIGQLLIEDDVVFHGPDGTAPTLTTNRFYIDATNGTVTVKFDRFLNFTAHDD